MSAQTSSQAAELAAATARLQRANQANRGAPFRRQSSASPRDSCWAVGVGLGGAAGPVSRFGARLSWEGPSEGKACGADRGFGGGEGGAVGGWIDGLSGFGRGGNEEAKGRLMGGGVSGGGGAGGGMRGSVGSPAGKAAGGQ
ncbi:unnamed protein product [Closterium sp. NIES-65]|nr:unnamed protein product [Closterium sp. NIES-65]